MWNHLADCARLIKTLAARVQQNARDIEELREDMRRIAGIVSGLREEMQQMREEMQQMRLEMEQLTDDAGRAESLHRLENELLDLQNRLPQNGNGRHFDGLDLGSEGLE